MKSSGIKLGKAKFRLSIKKGEKKKKKTNNEIYYSGN